MYLNTLLMVSHFACTKGRNSKAFCLSFKERQSFLQLLFEQTHPGTVYAVRDRTTEQRQGTSIRNCSALRYSPADETLQHPRKLRGKNGICVDTSVKRPKFKALTGVQEISQLVGGKQTYVCR